VVSRHLRIRRARTNVAEIWFAAWVTIINVISARGATDIILTFITLTFFALGSLAGLFKFCRLAGLTALSILGGMSVGMRVVLLRGGLLLRPAPLNWIIIALFMVVGLTVTFFRRRIGAVRVVARNVPQR